MPRTSIRGLAGALAFAAALLVTLPARAQTTGTLVGIVTDAATGAPVGGATVIATGRSLPGEQVATTGDDGSWQLAFMPPGPYVVRLFAAGYLDAERSDVLLKTDRTLKVAMSLVPSTVVLEEQVVTIVARPAVDPTNAQTGLVLPEALTDALPLPVSASLILPSSRSFEMAALAVAGADTDPLGVGFLGGASSENRYYVGGFDVTDPNSGVNLAPLMLDFVEEVDVKTGNYTAKYGRSSGGIVSAVTKSGSNELHGSVFTNLTPRWAFQPDGEFTGRDGQAFWTRDRNSRGAYDVDLGLELGGPIVRDRLWFHVGFAPVLSRTVTERTLRANLLPDALGACPDGSSDEGDGLCRDGEGAAVQEVIPGATRRWAADTRTWQFTGKLTWLATPEHTFTLSTFGTPYTRESVEPNTSESRRYLEERESVVGGAATWTGRFLSRRLLVEAVAGWMIDDRTAHRRLTDLVGADVPVKFWYASGFAPLPLGLLEPVPAECGGSGDASRCLVAEYATGGTNRTEYQAQRFNARLSASYLFDAFGAHAAEIGADVERSGFRDRRVRAGSAFYDMILTPSGTVLARAWGQGYLVEDPEDPDSEAVTPLWVDRMTFRPVVFTPALYLQDQWQPLPSLTVNAGLRWESLDMYDRLRPDVVDLEIRHSVAPRAQVIWDPSGRGRSKLAAGWGRFYETPPLELVDVHYNTLFRARFDCPAGTQVGAQALNPRTDCTPATFADGSSFVGTAPFRPVAPEIDGSFVDHFVLGAEHDLWRDVSVGIEYQGRRLGRVIEDMATEDGLFYLANPGVSRPFEYEGQVLDGRTLHATDPTTGLSYTAPVRRPQRSYDGITFKVSKLAARGLFGHASYTLSRLRGDYAGRLQLEYEQYEMPGQTVEYDAAEFLANRRGLLPGDRTHVLRLYGGYRWLPTPRLGLTLGAGVNSRSGTPVDVRAQVARDDFIQYDGHLAFIVPRGRGGRTPWITQVDLRAEVDYTLRAPWGLRFTVDAFNALDARSATALDEAYTNDLVGSISGAPCSGNPATDSNPSAAVTGACPDLAYLRTVDGRPVTVNRNWGRPTAYQMPLYLRIGAALTF